MRACCNRTVVVLLLDFSRPTECDLSRRGRQKFPNFVWIKHRIAHYSSACVILLSQRYKLIRRGVRLISWMLSPVRRPGPKFLCDRNSEFFPHYTIIVYLHRGGRRRGQRARPIDKMGHAAAEATFYRVNTISSLPRNGKMSSVFKVFGGSDDEILNIDLVCYINTHFSYSSLILYPTLKTPHPH